jgi:hypothetical protein
MPLLFDRALQSERGSGHVESAIAAAAASVQVHAL